MSEQAGFLAPQQAAGGAFPGRYVVHFGDVRTGALWGSLPLSGLSWTSEIREPGDVKGTVPACDETAGLWQELVGGRSLVAVEWEQDFGSRILFAGPVWGRDPSETGFTVGGTGGGGIFDHRLLVPDVPADQVATAPGITFANMDMGSIMRGIVAHVLALPDGDLPVVLEPERAGVRTQTYFGYDVAFAGTRIRELGEHDNGPDFLWLPRFADDDKTSIVWDFITGTEDEPFLTSSTPIVLDGLAPKQEVVGKVTAPDTASNLATTAWSKGGGSEGGTMIRAATDRTLLDQGWPRYDSLQTNQAEDAATVQAYADGHLARVRRPARGFTVEVKAAWWWEQNARLGDAIQLLKDHPVLGPLDVTSRLLSESGDTGSEWVKLTLADTVAEEAI